MFAWRDYCVRYRTRFPLHIRLTRKLAAHLNGLDLSEVEVGDVIYLAVEHAVMLIREGWAERVDR
jgi:hypothetical protein